MADTPNNSNEQEVMNVDTVEESEVVDVDLVSEETAVEEKNTEAKNGQDKCPLCGATDISVNPKTGKLRCNFCRYEFEPEKADTAVVELTQLEGEIVGSGAKDIDTEADNVITLKCSSCGAEVVIDTAETTHVLDVIGAEIRSLLMKKFLTEPFRM